MPKPTTPKIVMIGVEKIRVNDFNMNAMTPEEFGQYVAEVRRLGRPPKPTIVRPDGDSFEVVDGEHGLKAALDAGLKQVPCEVQDLDDFQAMAQCYKRNRGGHDNPVLLGRLFARMQQERKLSIRQLAKQVGAAESTIRNHLDFAVAAELRSSAHPTEPDKCVQEVSSLSHAQAKLYRSLPDSWRDAWLDNDADIEFLRSVCPDPANVGKGIARAGLEHVIDSENFRASVRFAWNLAVRRTDLHRLPDRDEFIGALAAVRLTKLRHLPAADVMDWLPCRVRDGGVECFVSVEEWSSILQTTARRAKKASNFPVRVQNAMLECLARKRVDIREVFGPDVGEFLDILDKSPDFIRAADHLSVEERAKLALAESRAPDEVVLRAKQMTVDYFRRLRDADAPEVPKDGGLPNGSVTVVFEIFVKRLLQERQTAAEDKLFADRACLLEAVLARLAAAKSLNGALVDGRPAAEVLAERLRAMAPAEFALLAAGLLGSPDPARRWLAAACGKPKAKEAGRERRPKRPPASA
jgi:hypothetical protein